MTSRFLVATLLGAVTLFFVGFLLWGVLFMDFMQAQSVGQLKEVPDPFWAMILGQVAFAALLVLCIQWAGQHGVGGGMKTAALVGFLYAASTDLSLLAVANLMTLTGAFADVLLVTVQCAVTGLVIGWWLSRGATADAA